jgi:hypothetical protein
MSLTAWVKVAKNVRFFTGAMVFFRESFSALLGLKKGTLFSGTQSISPV